MKVTWVHVVIGWGIIIAVIIACFISEYKKTSEQRKEELEKAKKRREEDRWRRQQKVNNAPAKGCLQSALELSFAGIFLLIAVIVCIIIVIASGS